MPLRPGMLISITTTSGVSAKADLDNVLSGGGLPDDLGVGNRFE